jgi:hypothetical protein
LGFVFVIAIASSNLSMRSPARPRTRRPSKRRITETGDAHALSAMVRSDSSVKCIAHGSHVGAVLSRHICPLQLPVITRALLLWTAPNDIVHTPFAGIGSEMVAALRLGRRAVGAELKLSYFTQAAANCHAASTNAQVDMFAPTPIPTAAQADTEPAPPL